MAGENLTALIRAYVAQIQELEGVMFELRDARAVGTAVGAQLDGLGGIIGEDRLGRDDDTYRIAIQSRIDNNSSNGTIEDLLDLIKTASGGDKTVRLSESFPAHFDAEIVEATDVSSTRIALFIRTARGAGIRGLLYLHEVDPPFGFDGTPGAAGFDEGSFSTVAEI